MKTIVNTLINLANTANNEANRLAALKDKASIDASKALFAKQAKIATLLKNIEILEQTNRLSLDASAHKLDPIVKSLSQYMKLALAPITAIPYGDKKLLEKLNEAQTNQMIDLANHAVVGLTENLESRNKAVKALNEENITADKVQERLDAYNKRCKEDQTSLMQALNNNPFAFTVSLEDANRRWTELLKRVFNVNLPENNAAKPAAKKNSFVDFFSTLLTAATGLFKDLSSGDSKTALMSFLGKTIPAVIGFFVNMLKPLFGNSAGEQEKNAKDFSDSASSFVMKMVQEEPQRPNLDVPKPKPNAKPDVQPEGAAITPLHENRRQNMAQLPANVANNPVPKPLAYK